MIDYLKKRGHDSVARTVDLTAAVAAQLFGSKALKASAALSFTTILSLIPLLAVVFAVLNAFIPSRAVVLQIQNWAFDTLFADSVAGITQHLEKFLDSSQGAVGIVGFSVLLLASLSLFLSVENSVNAIWRVPNSRPFHRRLITFYVLITLAPSLVALGSVSASWLLSSLDQAFLGVTLGSVVSWLLVLLALSLMYALVPHTKVSYRSAFIAALWASIVFQLSRSGFNLYVDMIYTGSVRSKIYGGFALIPVFFLWIYLIWIIILSGVTLTYLLENRQRLTLAFDRIRREGIDTSGPPNGYFLVRLFFEVAAHFFSRGGGIDESEVAEKFGLSAYDIRPAIDLLTKEGVLLSIERSDGLELLPGRPLEQTTIGDLYRIGKKRGFHPGYADNMADELEKFMLETDEDILSRYDKFTFAELVRGEQLEKNSLADD